MSRTFVSYTFATLLATVSLQAQGVDPAIAALWKNPIFQKQLIGSYGINSNIEPSLNANEQEIYDQIVPLIGTEPDQALSYLKRYTLPESSALFDFTLANLLFQKGDTRGAIEAYQAALKKFPAFRRAYQNLGVIYVQKGGHKEAIQLFTKAIALGQSDGLTFGLLGSAYVANNDFVAGEAAFRNALMLTPEVKDWKLGLARAFFSQSKFADAASLLESMVAENPNDATTWNLLASAHVGLNDLEKAAQDFEMIDQLGQATVENLNTQADIYVNLGLMDLAAEAYQRAYDKGDKSNITGPLRAAEILLARDGVSAAQKLLASVKASAGGNLPQSEQLKILRVEAKLAQSSGKREEAAAMLEQVVALDPLDGESLLSLGQFYATTDNPEKATFLYERAANLEDFTADANVRLAQLLVGKNKYNEAIPLLKRAQELKPRPAVAKFLEDLERFTKARR